MIMDYPFKLPPYHHQNEAFEKFKDSPYAALLAEMGTGKTKITIDILSYKYLKGELDTVVVIAPNAVHGQWVDEQFPTHCPVKWRGFSWNNDKKGTKKYQRSLKDFVLDRTPHLRVITINIESFQRSQILEIVESFAVSSDKPLAIIVDEASGIKNPDSKTTKNILWLARRFRDGFRGALTGTPAAKAPTNLYTIYEFLKTGYMQCSYTAFKHEYTLMVTRKVKTKQGFEVPVDTTLDKKTWGKVKSMIENNRVDGGKIPLTILQACARFGVTTRTANYIAEHPDFVQYVNVDKLRDFIAPDTFSVLKKDCLDLPDKVYQRIDLKLTPEQKGILSQLKQTAVAEHKGKVITVEQKSIIGVRALQVCGGFFPHHDEYDDSRYATVPITGANRKLEFIKQDLEELGDQQFLVWAVFKPELAMLHAELDKVASVGRYEAGAEDLIKEFKAGHLQGLICHPSSAGYGLNLQCAGTQYWYSRDYRTETRLQAEDRSHRIGIDKSPVYKDLVYNNPWEQAVLDNLARGKVLNDFIMAVGKDGNDCIDNRPLKTDEELSAWAFAEKIGLDKMFGTC